MLTIQPSFSRTSYNQTFTKKHYDDEARAAEIRENLKNEENDYNDEKSFWEEQRNNLNSLSKDNNVPSILKTPMKVISVVIAGILGGMAMVWGSKKSIGAMETLAETKKVKSFTTSTKNYFNSFKTAVSNAYKNFKNSAFAKKIEASYNKKVNKFNNSKIGKNKLVRGTIDGFKFLKKQAVSGYNYIAKKVKGIKGEQVKNATVNTMGVSGGVTSGLAAMKEADKAEQKDAE